MAPLIESVPNVSEGRRGEVVQALGAALREVPGLRVLDVQSDRDHNRSVFNLAGEAPALEAGILALFEAALPRIDLRLQQGAHPRMGAVDVVPFVPVEDATMEDCVALAAEVGRAVAERFAIPVFLYEEAATAPHRRSLEEVRRGEFEGLGEKMRDGSWRPDFGPATPHPSAGAVAVGARMPLVAFNINLGTSEVEVARRIAHAIRHSSGGFRYVKATAGLVEERGQAQVSINMTDHTRTPLFRVFETVRAEAARYGVGIVGSEIVGLVPGQALLDCAAYFLRLDGFDAAQILERRIREAQASKPARLRSE